MSIISVATIEEEEEQEEDTGGDIKTVTIENHLEKLDLRKNLRQQKGREEPKNSEFRETILQHQRAAANAQQSDDATPNQSEPPLNKNLFTRSSEDDTSIQGTIIVDGSSELEMERGGEEEEVEEEARNWKLKDETLADTYKRCFNESLPPESGTTS